MENNTKKGEHIAASSAGQHVRGDVSRGHVASDFELAVDLPRALVDDQLRLHYQPVVDATTTEIVGFEALVRWQHPRLGLLYPDRFLPIAVEAEFMIPLGRWVLQEACRQMKRWLQRSDANPAWFMSVNVESRQLSDPDTLIPDVNRALSAAELDPRHLKLELTEDARFDAAAVRPAVEMLKQRGVDFALDDFGTGFASLACLKDLPLDSVKLDRLFLRDVPVRERDVKLLESIVRVMDGFNLDVTIEGIETTAHAEVVRDLGCFGQGYYFCRPKAADDLSPVLAKWAENRHFF